MEDGFVDVINYGGDEMKGFMFNGKKILYCGRWNTHYKIQDDRMESNPDYWTKDLYYAPRLYKELILLSQKECLAFDSEHIGEIFFDYRSFCDEMRYQEEVDNDELTQLQIDYNELAKKHQLLVESNSKLMMRHRTLVRGIEAMLSHQDPRDRL